MITDFKNSRTYANIINSIDNELFSTGQYQLYGIKAQTEGYIQIGNIFQLTSINERVHAETFIRVLNDGELPSTYDNLQEAMNEERKAWSEDYKQYAQTARDEGYEGIADLFEGIAIIERHHDFRFRQLAANMENNQVFCKSNISVWICLACGNLVWNECAPEICPVCKYPQGFYQLNCENY